MINMFADLVQSLGFVRNVESKIDSTPIFNSESIVISLSTYLNDDELITFLLVNKTIFQTSKLNNQLQLRLLRIRVQRAEAILNQITDGPKSLGKKHKNDWQYQLYHSQLPTIPRYRLNILRASFTVPQKTNSFQTNTAIESQNKMKSTQNTKNEELKFQTEKMQSTMKTQQNQGYNKDELRQLVEDIKTIVMFDPKTNIRLYRDEPQPDMLVEIRDQGKYMMNQISRNLCPVVNYKRAREVFSRMYNQKWDDKLEKKFI